MAKIYALRDEKITEREIQNAQLAKKMACECMVLLKNDGTLPVQKNIPIALFGNGARNTIKGGTGSGDVNSRSNTNIENGLKELKVSKEMRGKIPFIYVDVMRDYNKQDPSNRWSILRRLFNDVNTNLTSDKVVIEVDTPDGKKKLTRKQAFELKIKEAYKI